MIPARAIAICLMSLATLVASAAHSQSFETAWLNDLSIQLLTQNDCEVAYFVGAKEIDDSSGIIFEARAKCADGRSFDARKRESEWAFSVKQCGAVAC